MCVCHITGLEEGILEIVMEWMYTNDYPESPCADPCHDTLKERAEELPYHIAIWVAAGHLKIKELADLAESRVRDIIDEKSAASSLPRAIRELYGGEDNPALREIISSAVAENIEELIKADDFLALPYLSPCSIDIIKSLLSKHRLKSTNKGFIRCLEDTGSITHGARCRSCQN